MKFATPSENKCLTCNLNCELKEKKGKITVAELDKAPQDCPYLKALEPLNESICHLNSILSNIRLEALYFKNLASSINQIYAALQNLSATIPTFYPPLELSSILEFPSPPTRPLTAKLIRKLTSCKKGVAHWKEYQLICKEIFTYLFVPPLDEPLEESKTKSGLQRRDLIFPIPYNAEGFWSMVRLKYGATAIIVDCKNYNKPIGKNEVLKVSQYLSKKKLGNFAIILTRESPSQSALKEITRLWNDEEKMIVCLNDEEIITMLKMKENEDEPEKLLERKILQFLTEIE